MSINIIPQPLVFWSVPEKQESKLDQNEISELLQNNTKLIPGHFIIRKATKADQDQIIQLVQTAYYNSKGHYHLPEEKKGTLWVRGIINRLDNPEKYTTLVCVAKNQVDEQIVGTCYVQFKDTDYPNLDGTFSAELGTFAIDPAFRKGYGIGPRILIEMGKQIQDKKVQTIYGYIVDTVKEEREPGQVVIHSQQGLQDLYTKFGLSVTMRKFSEGQPKQDRFKSETNPEGKVPLIVMSRRVDTLGFNTLMFFARNFSNFLLKLNGF